MVAGHDDDVVGGVAMSRKICFSFYQYLTAHKIAKWFGLKIFQRIHDYLSFQRMLVSLGFIH